MNINRTEKLNVENDVIDKQYNEWLTVINEFHKSILEKKPIDTIEDALLKVLEYTRFHFKYEEDYMQEQKHPNLEEHKSQHFKYIRDIETYYEKLMTGKLILSEKIAEELKMWAINHLKDEEIDYSKE